MSETDSSHMDRALQRLLGTVLAGRYRIDGVLGKGGMGAVFRAEHLLLKRDMAVKVLHPRLSQNPQITERFHREAQSAARLEHPNIVRVTEFGRTDAGIQFLVMELLEGCELHTLLGHPLNPLRAAELVWQILSGLEHAHTHGVVHRDLKPENIFVTHDHRGREVLKLVDFGVAKVLGTDREGGHEQSLTRVGVVFGTPAYMSPEQAMGAKVDVRTDLYSVGAIFYEMLTGRPPLTHDDPVSLVRMQVSVDPEPLPGSIPESIRSFVDRLLAKNRDHRFPDATEARKQLERAVATLGGRPDSSRTRTPVIDAAASWPADLSTTRGARPQLREKAKDNWLGQGALSWRHADFTDSRARGRRGGRVMLWSLLTVVGLVAAAIGWREWSHRNRGEAGPKGVEAELLAGFDDGIEKVSQLAKNLSERVMADSSPPGPAKTTPRPDPAPKTELEPIDAALIARDGPRALKAIAEARTRYPQDPALAWRAAKAYGLDPAQGAEALSEYRRALELAPELTNDQFFVGELSSLMAQPKLRDPAIDLALDVLGARGHEFLLQQLNGKRPRKREIAFARRQRMATSLRRSPAIKPRIDEVHVLRVDLWQAARTTTPCRDLNRTIAAIAELGDPALIPDLRKLRLPKIKDNSDEAELCARLPGRLAGARSDLANREASRLHREKSQAAGANTETAQGEDQGTDAPATTNAHRNKSKRGAQQGKKSRPKRRATAKKANKKKAKKRHGRRVRS